MAIRIDIKRTFVYIYFLGLVVLLSYLSFRNTAWLSGWDTLHPEFNFSANISKLISGGWDESRGLGIVNGMAQVADLSRTLFLWGLSLLMPIAWLRMIWIALMWFVGITGIWKLFDDGLIGQGMVKRRVGGVIAASFYLLNVGTILTFYLPFEPFTSFFGVLPWLVWGVMKIMRDGRKCDYLNLLLIYILGASAFYVQTLFVVWVVVLITLGFDGILKYGVNGLKRLGMILLITLVANAYWLAPVGYFTLTQAEVVGSSAGNLQSTTQMQLINSVYGGLSDIAQMRGYLLSYISWMGGQSYGVVAQVWQDHLYKNYVEWAGYALFVMSIGGMIVEFGRKYKNYIVGSLFLLSYLMLAMNNAPFGNAYEWMMTNVPLFGQIFRVPYTKWLPVYILVNSFGLGLFITWIWQKLGKYISVILIALIIGIGLVRIYPVISGEMVSKKMRVNLPQEYFRLFEYMKRADYGRVVELPAHSMWGWNIYNWGYEGSGFLWYGIEQPILDRAFDVWSPYNEGFYNEFSNALYGGENDWVKSVLDKYDVRYVLLDESVIAPGQDKEILRIEETNRLASELGWKQVFQEGFLTVWDRGEKASTFVSAPQNYTWVEGGVDKVRRDVVWEGVGTYVSDNPKTQSIGESDNSESRILYPFAGLMREETKGIEYRGNGITISSDHSAIIAQGSELWVPGWRVGDIVRINYGDGEALPAYTVNGHDGPRFLGKERPEEGKSYIVARVSEGEEWGEYLQDARFQILDSRIDIMIDGEAEIYDFSKQGQGTIGNCDVLKRGRAEKSQLTGSLPVSPTDRLNILADSQDFVSGRDPGEQGTSYVADERGAVCDYIVMSELDTRLSYLMRMQGENKEGRSLKFFLYNTGSKRNDIEYLLGKGKFDQTFGLLPWTWDGHYTLNIETRSFGQYAENRVKPVEVRWVPLEQIARARIESQSSDHSPKIAQQSELEIRTVRKYGTWLYIVETKNGGLLKLSQGYDEGWVSPYLEHVKVEGWANGWMVPAGEHRIVIFYWPQLLEYLGFGLLGVTIIVLWRQKR